MKELWDKIWKYLAALVIGIFIGFMINIPSCNKVEPNIIKVPVHDTVKVDSIRIEQNTKIKYITTVDTFYIVQKQDTIYLKDFPIEYKTYKDTISTDSTSAELKINYHGFSAGIDDVNLIYSYNNKKEIVPEKKKSISPFIMLEVGPIMNYDFSGVRGASIGLNAGLILKNNFGFTAGYQLNASKDIQHVVKIGVIKQF